MRCRFAPQLMVLAQARLNAATRNGDDSGNEYEAAGLGDFAEILQVIGNGDDYDPDLLEDGVRVTSSDRESTMHEANQNWSDQEAKERVLPAGVQKVIPPVVSFRRACKK
jgi:hypothetical protein